jgi:UDP-2-acetamido-2-deoxy-ribo-hexuluronate aminotransferase
MLDNEEKRDLMQMKLKAEGIPTMIYYSKPLHLQNAYQGLGYKPGSLPQSELAAKRVLSLPLHPYLISEDVYNVTDKIKWWISNELYAKS